MTLDLECHTTEYYTGDGVKTSYNLPFDFVEPGDINVAWYSAIAKMYQTVQPNVSGYEYTVDIGSNGSFVIFKEPPENNQKFMVYRLTAIDPLKADFEPGFPIKAQDLDDNFVQLRNAIEDTRCIVEGLIGGDVDPDDPDDIYWKKAGETNYSNNGWNASDCYIGSTLAIENRIRDIVHMDVNPPAATSSYDGQLWWDTDDGNLYVYYNDGNSQQWVETSSRSDAVSDGTVYGRQDGNWVQISTTDISVNSVNGQVGVVTLGASDVGAATTAQGALADTAIQPGVVNPVYFADQAAFPSATTYHGGIAHSHADGAMYYAHGGSWNKLANDGGDITGNININITGNITATGNINVTGDTTHAGDITVTGNSDLTGAFDLNGTYTSNVVAVSALDIDCSSGNYFTKTINGASTFTFSDVPSSGIYSFTLEITHTSGSITWPTSVKFPGDSAPSLTDNTTHLFVFLTDDGGTRWRANALVDFVN